MLSLFCFVCAPVLQGSMTLWNKYDSNICTCFGVKCSWDSVVSTVTMLNGLDDPGLESPQGKVLYFSAKRPVVSEAHWSILPKGHDRLYSRGQEADERGWPLTSIYGRG